ncbi:flagellar hook-associated protein FlgL [Saccharibacillus kuerlensis]|uniref:Flagellar hook-associated protein FlgL n=1 Tax=Saccharibacillus kuerlensis TaxID=459527 RepID=A0ABQ2KUK3_9BACL|nr:flagellar hook-associated protein FlgL [Saccharibacillus kuerlensis]GGN93246.1 flagellar hook-associated protein FlgL [Saccharibacillus kuerlensis]
MTIRMTSNMMSSTLLGSLNKNLYNMDKLEGQISSGRKINKPSDDPVGVTYALRYRSQLAGNEQFQRATDSAQSWLDETDSQMGSAGNVMTRLKELMVQASTGTYSGSDMQAAALEVEQLKKQLVDIGNSKFGGKFIFNGQSYESIPYPVEAGTDYSKVETDNTAVKYVIGENIQFQINTSGNEFFGAATDNDNAFALMDRLVTALGSGKQDDITAEMGNIESRTSKMLAARSEVGARTNRVELVNSRLQDQEMNTTTLLSKTEDLDMAEALIKATSAQTVYEAALKSSAKIMSTSLIDFMR